MDGGSHRPKPVGEDGGKAATVSLAACTPFQRCRCSSAHSTTWRRAPLQTWSGAVRGSASPTFQQGCPGSTRRRCPWAGSSAARSWSSTSGHTAGQPPPGLPASRGRTSLCPRLQARPRKGACGLALAASPTQPPTQPTNPPPSSINCMHILSDLSLTHRPTHSPTATQHQLHAHPARPGGAGGQVRWCRICGGGRALGQVRCGEGQRGHPLGGAALRHQARFGVLCNDVLCYHALCSAVLRYDIWSAVCFGLV